MENVGANLDVERILKEKGVGYRLVELSQEAFTVDDVVKYSKGDVNPNEICKTIILCGRKTGKRAAFLLRGNDKLDFSKIKKLLGEEMAIANQNQVKEASGVEPGAVCPFLVKVPLFVDERVMFLKQINCGSGHHLYGLEFKSEDLSKSINYELVDLSKTVSG